MLQGRVMRMLIMCPTARWIEQPSLSPPSYRILTAGYNSERNEIPPLQDFILLLLPFPANPFNPPPPQTCPFKGTTIDARLVTRRGRSSRAPLKPRTRYTRPALPFKRDAPSPALVLAISAGAVRRSIHI